MKFWKNKYLRKRMLEHLWGPTGSIILHILILYALIHLVVFEVRDTQPDVEVQMRELDVVDIDDLLDELEQELEPLDLPDVPIDAPDMDFEMEEPDPQDFVQDEPDVDYDALNILDTESSLVMQGLFSGRSPEGRARRLGEYGGRWGEHTEAAVLRALEWLRLNQNDDGSWDHGARAPAAMTGLGLLTFLAHGETQDSPRYGRTVRRAIQYMINNQQEDGNFTGTRQHVYGHALATYALAEAFAMTRIPAIKPAMDKGIKVIIDGQQPGGGWDYDYAKGDRRDTSITAFNVQAFKAALLAGSDHKSGIERSMAKAIEDLNTAWDADRGHFFYTHSRSWTAPGLTALAVLCYQLAGHSRDTPARGGLRTVQEERVDWNDPGPWAMYRWYYVTQAIFHGGGGAWNAWNNSFAPAFIQNQNDDGSWDSPSRRLPSGTTGREEHYGPVYATTFAALSLQVYYRLLPTFAVTDEPEKEPEPEEEVIIEII